MGSAQEIAKLLKDQKVSGEYLFFAAYMAKSDEKEASDVNGRYRINKLSPSLTA
jgi:hypothetical protein